jgi:hypothetical protein
MRCKHRQTAWGHIDARKKWRIRSVSARRPWLRMIGLELWETVSNRVNGNRHQAHKLCAISIKGTFELPVRFGPRPSICNHGLHMQALGCWQHFMPFICKSLQRLVFGRCKKSNCATILAERSVKLDKREMCLFRFHLPALFCRREIKT